MRESVRAHVARWKFNGSVRPDFAQVPKEGEESVWDYPRPPACTLFQPEITIFDKEGGNLVAKTKAALKMAETSSPPTFYINPKDVDLSALVKIPSQSSRCEWKGLATYWAFKSNPTFPVAWSYRDPEPEYKEIKDFLAFYPSRAVCFVGEERVAAQKSEFYGGWVLKNLVGPWK